MKRIYEIGKTYGNYTLVARENYRTSSGRYSQRLKCKNNVTGQFVFLHASGLKEHVEHLEKVKENFDRG